MGRRKKLNAKEREEARKRREEAQREKEQYLVKLKEDKASCDAMLDNLGLSISTSSEKNDQTSDSIAAQQQQTTKVGATGMDTEDYGENKGRGDSEVPDEYKIHDEQMLEDNDQGNKDSSKNDSNDNGSDNDYDNDNGSSDEESEEELEEGTTLSRSGLSLTMTSPSRQGKSDASVDSAAAASKAETIEFETPISRNESKDKSATRATVPYRKPAQPPPPSVLPPPPSEEDEQGSSARNAKHRYQSSLLSRGKSWHGTSQEEDKTGGTSTKQRKLMFQQSLKDKTAANKAASARRLEGIGENDVPSSPLPTEEYLKRAKLQTKFPSERIVGTKNRSNNEAAPTLPPIEGEGGDGDCITPMSTRERMKLLQKEQSTKKKAEYLVRPEERPASIVRSASTSLAGEHKKQDKQDAVKNETLQELAELRTKKMTRFIHAKFDTIAERNAAVKAAEEAIYAQLEARQEAGSIGSSSHRKKIPATGGSDDASSIGSGKVTATSIDNALSVVDKVYFERKKREEIERKRQREYKEKHIHTHQYDSQSDIVSPMATSASRARKTLIVPTQFRGAASVSEHALKRGAKGEVDDSSQHTETSSIKGKKRIVDKKAKEVQIAKKGEASVETKLQSNRPDTSAKSATTTKDKEQSTGETKDVEMQEPKIDDNGEVKDKIPSSPERAFEAATAEAEVVVESTIDAETEPANESSSPAGIRGDEGGQTEDMVDLPVVPFVPDLDEELDEEEDVMIEHIPAEHTPRSLDLECAASSIENNSIQNNKCKVTSLVGESELNNVENANTSTVVESSNHGTSSFGNKDASVAIAIASNLDSTTVDASNDIDKDEFDVCDTSKDEATDQKLKQKPSVSAKARSSSAIVGSNEKHKKQDSVGKATNISPHAEILKKEPDDKDVVNEKPPEPVRVGKPQYVEPAVSFDYQSKGSTSSVTERLKDVPSGFKGIPEPVNKDTGYEYDSTCKDCPKSEEKTVRVSPRQYVEPAISFDHQSKDSSLSITDRLKDVPSGFKGMPDPINQDTGYEYDSTCKDFPKSDRLETKASRASEVQESSIQSVNRDGTAPLKVRSSLKESEDKKKAEIPKPVNAATGYKIAKGLNSAEVAVEGPSAAAIAAEVNEREATAMDQAAIERAKEMARIMVEGGDLWTTNGTTSSVNSTGGVLGGKDDDDGSSSRVLQFHQDYDDDVSALSLHTSRSAGGSTVNVDQQYPITPRTPVERRRWVIHDVPGAATGKDVARRRGSSAKDEDIDSAPSVDSKRKKFPVDAKAKIVNMDEPDQWFTYWSDEHEREYYYNPRFDEVAWRIPIGEEHKLVLESPSQRSQASASYRARAGVTMSREFNPSGTPKSTPVRASIGKNAPQSFPVPKSATVAGTTSMSNTERQLQSTSLRPGPNLDPPPVLPQSPKRGAFQPLSEVKEDDDNEEIVLIPKLEQSQESGSIPVGSGTSKKIVVFMLFSVFAAVAAFGLYTFVGENEFGFRLRGHELGDVEASIDSSPISKGDGNIENLPKKGPIANLRNVFSGGNNDVMEPGVLVEKERRTSSVKKESTSKKKEQSQTSTTNLKPSSSASEIKKASPQKEKVETEKRAITTTTPKESLKVTPQMRQPKIEPIKNAAETDTHFSKRDHSTPKKAALTQTNSAPIAIQMNDNSIEQEETSLWSLVGAITGTNVKDNTDDEAALPTEAAGLVAMDTDKRKTRKKKEAPMSDAIMLKDKKRPRYCYIPLAYLLSRQCRRFARVKPIADTMSPEFLAI